MTDHQVLDNGPSVGVHTNIMDDKDLPPVAVETPELSDALAEAFGDDDDGPEEGLSSQPQGSQESEPKAAKAEKHDPITPRQAPVSDETPGEDSVDGSEEPSGEAVPELERSEEEATALADALRVLRRGHMLDSAIAKMSDSEVLAQAAALKPVISERDRDFNRQSSEEQSLAENGTDRRGPQSQVREPSDLLPPTDSLQTETSQLLEHLGLSGDEQAEEALAAFGSSIAGRTSAEIQLLRQEMAVMRGESAGTIGELVRNELVSSERYPQFADPKKWEPVEAKAVSLLKSPDYGGDIRKALADAVRLEAGPGRELPSPGEALRIATARANGNPDIPTGSNREKPSKPDDILDHNIETAMEHRGVR